MNAMTDVAATTSAARAGASVEAAGITKRFPLAGGGEVVALSGIDLALAPGSFVAIVGPSGCGKSTLLRLVAGLDAPDQGTIRIDGEPPAAAAAHHRIGVAFQDHALLPWLSVRQNVALPFRLAGLAVDEARVASLVTMVGLAEFAAARPSQLSGGMRQRVSIARSLALSPSLLLLDEPFGALDLVTRRALNLEMQRVWESLRTTTLLITHSVDEAVQLADRVIVMASKPGRLHASFDVALERPRTRATTQGDAFAALTRRVAGALDDAMA